MSPTIAPPGWYPDPASATKVRWWDGRHWTDRIETPRPDLQPSYGYLADGGSVSQQLDYA